MMVVPLVVVDTMAVPLVVERIAVAVRIELRVRIGEVVRTAIVYFAEIDLIPVETLPLEEDVPFEFVAHLLFVHHLHFRL